MFVNVILFLNFILSQNTNLEHDDENISNTLKQKFFAEKVPGSPSTYSVHTRNNDLIGVVVVNEDLENQDLKDSFSSLSQMNISINPLLTDCQDGDKADKVVGKKDAENEILNSEAHEANKKYMDNIAELNKTLRSMLEMISGTSFEIKPKEVEIKPKEENNCLEDYTSLYDQLPVVPCIPFTQEPEGYAD